MPTQPAWWKTAVFYQIYPRSFQDSNADGIGDLTGILQRLPYVRDLGADAVWLSPIFPSPMKDFGYDISNYIGIEPIFGTMDDFSAFVARSHALDLKVILDLVPNHTSDQHPWFLDSRSSRNSNKRDWYLWREAGPDGEAPNNWMSEFGGSAWARDDDATGDYYYHAFLKEQPDLNWRNPEVRAAIYDVMRFWLRLGVDGFRVDVIWHLIKDEQFRDNPPNLAVRPNRPPHEQLLPIYSADRPEIHTVIAEMRGVIDEFEDRVLIGEIYLPIERLVTYYGKDLSGAHLPFNFALLSASWNARAIAAIIDEYEAALPVNAWPNWVLGNHDRPRVASRVGAEQARVAAMLLLTLRGTPTLYYGDELGIPQVEIPIDKVRDPFEKNVPGIGVGRDGCRTPMQWDASSDAGFSRGVPWLPPAEDFQQRNVSVFEAEPQSILSLYKALIQLRRAEPALHSGSYRLLEATENLLTYERQSAGDAMVIALNLGAEPQTLHTAMAAGEILLSTEMERAGERVSANTILRGNEGVVIRALVMRATSALS